MATCLVGHPLWISLGNGGCDERRAQHNAEVEARRDFKLDKQETKNDFKLDKQENRQSGRTERTTIRTENGATAGQALSSLGNSAASLFGGGGAIQEVVEDPVSLALLAGGVVGLAYLITRKR